MAGNLLGREVTAEDVAQAFLHRAVALKTTADVTTVDGGNIAAALRWTGDGALSRSLPLRETQGKFFSGPAPHCKAISDQHLARDSPVEPTARQGNGREAENRRIAVWPRTLIAIIVIIH